VATALVEVVIPFRAVPERKRQRPYADRVTGEAKYGPRTDEPRQKAWKEAAAAFMQQAMRKAGHEGPLACPMRVLITRRRPAPKKPSETVPDLRFDTSTPDYDNFSKIAGDAGNGILWADDRLIVEGTTRKEFGLEECLIVTVWEALP
jgi:Holliday junction resolvase RusA-like endonuclease